MLRRTPHPDDEVDFLLSLPRFATEAGAQWGTFDLNRAEYYRNSADDYARALYAMSMVTMGLVEEDSGNAARSFDSNQDNRELCKF
ncbi:hypothetical protein SNE40_015101 [Patella caerulea]|uniref:Uncharacterized protein n=1 Tax=Patella caerulea TaxID=87958 RepID=A0AAN8JMJ1_PATCE